jgi:translation initiation factor 1A
MTEDEDINVDRLPEDEEVFGRVTNMLGANRVTVVCSDGKERQGRIPGKMQKQEWIRKDDLVIVDPWDWQDEKADIAYRYSNQEAKIIEDSDLIENEEQEI